jgi:restriction endonuclease
MTLFRYADPSRSATIQAVGVADCMFCSGDLTLLHRDEGTRKVPRYGLSHGPGWERWAEVVRRCRRCGWWCRKHTTYSEVIDHQYTAASARVSGAAGCLKKLDLSYGDTPVQEIRDYLAGRYQERFDVHPRVFEEVVASVFKDLGYDTIVTNYSGDDGIDVFMAKGGATIGVQVKRYKNGISVGQIRELAGALLLNDVETGMFVTTSHFQSGADNTVSRYAMRGMPIELVDADRFYSALEIAQAGHYAQESDELIRMSREMSDILRDEHSRSL